MRRLSDASHATHDRQDFTAHPVVLDRRVDAQHIDRPACAQDVEQLGLIPSGNRIALVEERGDRHFEKTSDLAQAPCANPIRALFILLDLLEGYADSDPKRSLA